METCTNNYLSEQIALLNPSLVMLLGTIAAKRMLGIRTITQIRGQVVEQDGRKYLVGHHPAAQFYSEHPAGKVKEDFALLRTEITHLL